MAAEFFVLFINSAFTKHNKYTHTKPTKQNPPHTNTHYNTHTPNNTLHIHTHQTTHTHTPNP